MPPMAASNQLIVPVPVAERDAALPVQIMVSLAAGAEGPVFKVIATAFLDVLSQPLAV